MKQSISVVIPTYNRVEPLKRALKSVFAQTRCADQILVIDDGSSDATAQMIERYFPQVEYCYQENRGVSSARNFGIAQAKCDWIALLDSDDEWLPNKLEIQVDRIRQNAELQISHTDEIWVRNGRRVNPMKKHTKHGGWIFHKCLPLCVMSPSSVLINRSVFATVGLFDETLPACEDYDLWLRICSRYPVLYVDSPLLIKYGGHHDQLSRRYWGMDRFRIQALQHLLMQDYLTDVDRYAAQKMLVSKAAIYAKGARKRRKLEEAIRYESLCRQYAYPT